MPSQKSKRLTPVQRANIMVRELIPPKFSKSKQYKSALKYVDFAKEGRPGRASMSRPFWFNRVESEVQRKERRAFAQFHNPEFTARLQRLPESARLRVIRKYAELRRLNGGMQKISRLERVEHPQTPASMNRAGFDERVEAILQRPDRKPLSFAVVDMDFFGAVNKVFGNEIGNRVLEKFTESFKSALSVIGFHGRVGGDEFQVMGRVTPREMKIFLDRFRSDFVQSLNAPSFLRVVRELKMPRAKMSEWKAPSFTAGVAGMDRHSRKISDVGVLFRRMDAAMQRGKRAGKERTLLIRMPPAA